MAWLPGAVIGVAGLLYLVVQGIRLDREDAACWRSELDQ